MHGIVILSQRLEFIESDRCIKWNIHRDSDGHTE